MNKALRFTLMAAIAIFVAIVSAPVRALAVDTVPVYRLWNYYDGQHLITIDENEYRVLQRNGWQGEGEVFRLPRSGGQTVYRLLNRNNGDHLYTASTNEYQTLQRKGWTGEGPKFSGAPGSEGIPVYRLWNSAQTDHGALGSHLWTADANEYNTLPKTSWAWHRENVAWRAYQPTGLPSNPTYIDATRSGSHTLYGTIIREQRPTSVTGMGWSSVCYLLKLERPITLRYRSIFSNTPETLSTSKVLLSFQEKYAASVGWDHVNQGLDRIFDENLQPHSGYRVAVTGSFGNMTGHTPYSPLFSRTALWRVS